MQYYFISRRKKKNTRVHKLIANIHHTHTHIYIYIKTVIINKLYIVASSCTSIDTYVHIIIVLIIIEPTKVHRERAPPNYKRVVLIPAQLLNTRINNIIRFLITTCANLIYIWSENASRESRMSSSPQLQRLQLFSQMCNNNIIMRIDNNVTIPQ